ncbi:MAG: hypothetical protein ACJ74Z_10570, partial [Bryobacteraceae bacterium]
RIAEQSTGLLKNNGVLALDRQKVRSIANRAACAHRHDRRRRFGPSGPARWSAYEMERTSSVPYLTFESRRNGAAPGVNVQFDSGAKGEQGIEPRRSSEVSVYLRRDAGGVESGPGSYSFIVCASSKDLRLHKTVRVE